jgi:hypothetical protein
LLLAGPTIKNLLARSLLSAWSLWGLHRYCLQVIPPYIAKPYRANLRAAPETLGAFTV